MTGAGHISAAATAPTPRPADGVKATMRIMRNVLFAAFFFFHDGIATAASSADTSPDVRTGSARFVLRLAGDSLRLQGGRRWLTQGWRAHAGDSSAWAAPGFDDTGWETMSSLMLPEEPRPAGWNGIGWFRLHIETDSTMAGILTGIVLYQAGACELYVDGRLAARIGVVGASGQDERPLQSLSPVGISLGAPGRHVIAVRFSDFSTRRVTDADVYAGFHICFGEISALSSWRLAQVSRGLTNRMIFGVVPLTLALLHLILFAFYPRDKGNLHYSLCMIGFSGIVFATTQQVFASTLGESVAYIRVSYLAENTAIIFGLLMMYTFTGKKTPLHGWIIIGAGAILALSAFVYLRLTSAVQDFYLVLVIAEMIRGVASVRSMDADGSWILGAGSSILIVTLIFQLLIGYGIIAPIGGLENGYLYGALALGISMSLFLSRKFARTHYELEAQITQVKELSGKALDQERLAREAEIERRLLEADNKRKTDELDEARKVQLSMLPVCRNDIPGFDLCFSMRTATEIGGDYYDYAFTPERTLNVVIGDATGHGMKSALMVATIKSMFSAMGSAPSINGFFNRCTEIIKDMNLGNLFMSMSFVRIHGRRVEYSAAGMPPLLVCRAGGSSLESVKVKGMPLGAHRNFPYESRCFDASPGDVLVLLSDGYTELFNEQRAMIDPALIERTLIDSAALPASEIVSALFRTGDAWRGSRALDDDITLVVIRII